MASKRRVTPFDQRLHDAERRAKRKLHRLELKGIHTRSINPIQDITSMSVGQKRRYERELEAFISRQTRYHRGYEGTPISNDTVKAIRKAEKQLNAKRDKLFKKIAGSKLLVPGTDMTVSDYRNMTRRYDAGSGKLVANPKSPFYSTEHRHRDISHLKGEGDAARYIEALERAGGREYIQFKNTVLRKNMRSVLSQLNEPELVERVMALSDEDIYQLLRTPFIESVFMNSGRDGVSVVQGIVEHLNNMLDSIGAD